ncbi:hypothetical protein DFQ27_000699 [Actinomortierella ambigua]|uniref:AB hydrolase-1 domain-containing protein n=1 Tax=Actinomortierella ambigua TaxID=1343610 RepID=A0A9P6QEE6_9FUNG|nr:hypothetical protein DFQ27_000699 [Actinomortierella ambigua]
MVDGKAHYDALLAATKDMPVPAPTGAYHDPASFNHKFATVSGGFRYHYVEEGDPSAPTILMVHGFPDLWYGWRHQIRHLASQGYHVIAVDTLGYGQTDAPKVELDKLHPYSTKNVCAQICGLLDVLNIPKVIILGHDWGGAIVWRFADFHPDRVKAVISVCTPTTPLMDTFVPIEVIAMANPDFAYQIFFSDPATTELLDGKIREFLFTALRFSGLHDEELDYYVQEFSRNGFHGPLNYYRTRQLNYEDELPLPRQTKRPHPSCLIVASHDPVLKPALSENMGQQFESFERVFVTAGHFALTENPKEVNAALDAYLAKLLPEGPKAKI